MQRLLDTGSHNLHLLWNEVVHLASNLVVMRLILLDVISSLPEGVTRLPGGFGCEPNFGLMFAPTAKSPFVKERPSTRNVPRLFR